MKTLKKTERKNGFTIRGRMAAPVCIALLGVLSGPVPIINAATIDISAGATAAPSGAYTSIIVGDTASASAATATETVAASDSGTFTLGNVSGATGNYNLTGGVLTLTNTAADALIGNAGAGTFTQSTGTTVTYSGGEIDIGGGASGDTASVGTYNMNGGAITAKYMAVGLYGTGTFTQTTGVNTANTLLAVGFESGSTGVYNLNGGTIVTAELEGASGTSTLNLNGGTLQAKSTTTTLVTGLTHAYVQAGGATINYGTFTITAGQALTHDPALGATLDGGLTVLGSGTLSLTTVNTFTGAFTATAGFVNVNVNNALGSASAVNLSGTTSVGIADGLTGTISHTAAVSINGSAILNSAGAVETVGSLSGTSSTASLVIGDDSSTYAGSFTVGDSTNTAFAGIISGTRTATSSIILTKQGTGTLTLSGANTYSGTTSITAGTLLAANTTGSATGTGPLSIGTAGTLASGAGSTGIVTGLVTTAGTGSQIAPGATATSKTGTVGTLTLSGGLNLTLGATIDFDLGANTANSDSIKITAGTFTASSTNVTTFAFNNIYVQPGTYVLATFVTGSGLAANDFAATGVAGTFSIVGTNLDFMTTVPEPATYWAGALCIGMAGAGMIRRRRRAI